jgi:hypothetical protein
MFSFVQWFGKYFDKIKKNKGLWFTFLTVISLFGIFVSLYFVNFLVSDVAKKTYENQKISYQREIKNQIELQKASVLAIASTIVQNNEVKFIFESNSSDKTKKINSVAKDITQNIMQNSGVKYYSVNFEQEDKDKKVEIINGLYVDKLHAHFRSQLSIIEDNTTRLQVVVKESLKILFESFKREKKEFVFMLNDSSINKIDPFIKKGYYQKIHDRFFVEKNLFNQGFVDRLKTAKIDQLIEDGYLKDSHYFYVSQKAYDNDGDEIGLIVTAEEITDENSFVNLVKNLVNSVTSVALGLIVSMVLFLF